MLVPISTHEFILVLEWPKELLIKCYVCVLDITNTIVPANNVSSVRVVNNKRILLHSRDSCGGTKSTVSASIDFFTQHPCVSISAC